MDFQLRSTRHHLPMSLLSYNSPSNKLLQDSKPVQGTGHEVEPHDPQQVQSDHLLVLAHDHTRPLRQPPGPVHAGLLRACCRGTANHVRLVYHTVRTDDAYRDYQV